MSYIYRSNTPPAYPKFVPLQEQPNNGKSRFREWGKRDPVPITLTLATKKKDTTDSEIPRAPWERARTSDDPAQNIKVLAIIRESQNRKEHTK